MPLRMASYPMETHPDELKGIVDNLMRNHYPVFARILPGTNAGAVETKIERVYSRDEIRCFVSDCLIPEYQLEPIINAVTDYLYGLHVGPY